MSVSSRSILIRAFTPVSSSSRSSRKHQLVAAAADLSTSTVGDLGRRSRRRRSAVATHHHHHHHSELVTGGHAVGPAGVLRSRASLSIPLHTTQAHVCRRRHGRKRGDHHASAKTHAAANNGVAAAAAATLDDTQHTAQSQHWFIAHVKAVPWSRVVNVLLIGAIVWHAATFFLSNSPKLQQYWDSLLNSRHAQRLWSALTKLPADNWMVYESAMQNAPWRTSAIISGVAYFLADWTAQTYEGSGVFGFSTLRLLRTTLVGAAVLAPFAHWYYSLQDALIPTAVWFAPPLKLVIDQTIYVSFYNVIFLGCCGLLSLQSPSRVFTDVRENYWPVLKAGWRLWPFVHILTYTVIPTSHKLLWVDAVEVAWVTYLSMVANRKRAETIEVVSEMQAESKAALGERATELDEKSDDENPGDDTNGTSTDGKPELVEGISVWNIANEMAVRIYIPDRPNVLLETSMALADLKLATTRGSVEVKYNHDGERMALVELFVSHDAKVSHKDIQDSVALSLGLACDVTDSLDLADTGLLESVDDDEQAEADSEAEAEEESTARREFVDPKTNLMYAIEVETATAREVRDVLELEHQDTEPKKEIVFVEEELIEPTLAAVDAGGDSDDTSTSHTDSESAETSVELPELSASTGIDTDVAENLRSMLAEEVAEGDEAGEKDETVDSSDDLVLQTTKGDNK